MANEEEDRGALIIAMLIGVAMIGITYTGNPLRSIGWGILTFVVCVMFFGYQLAKARGE